MHKLLQKQIKKVFGDSEEFSDRHKTLLNLISESYKNNDNDRLMLERVLQSTSEEMRKMNEKLKEESEEALKQIDIRLKQATNAANVGIWEFDLIKNEVIWNEITYKLYGITDDPEIDGITAWQKYVHPDDQIMANTELLDAINGNREFDIEYRITWPDNSIRFLRTKGMVQHDNSGKAIKMIGTKWDITEKKKAQENIKREKELADSVINSLPGIFFIFTAEGKILRWNNNFIDVTGYSSDELGEMNPLDFFDDDEREKMIKEIENVLIKGRSDTEANIITKGKKKIPFFFNSILVNYDGEDCIIGTAINIEERKRAEERLKTKNKDLEEFAYIVSHSLRAPIAKIEGLAELINSGTDEKNMEENLNMLKYIKDEVISLEKIIQQMNEVIREREYVYFTKEVSDENAPYTKIKNLYLIDDDPVVNIISKKTIERTGFAGKINVHDNASKVLESLKILCEENVNDFPEVIFLDINMPGMNGWEFLDEFHKLKEHVKKKCKIYMLTSSIDPNDVKRSQSYVSVKDFITKPLTKEKLHDLKLAV